MGFGLLAVTVTDGKGKEKEKAEVVGKKQGRAREISKNSLVKELVPRKKRNLVLSPSPGPSIAILASGSNPTCQAHPVEIPPSAPEQPAANCRPALESGSAIGPVAVAPAAVGTDLADGSSFACKEAMSG
jgi:hypothetical protein